MIAAPLTNKAYGYPTGGRAAASRPCSPCRTRRQRQGRPDGRAELRQPGREHGPVRDGLRRRDGPSCGRRPRRFAAWSQGDVAHPDALAQEHIVAGVNFNEVVFESVEVCGAGASPSGRRSSRPSRSCSPPPTGRPGCRVDRAHVLAHADVNSVSRASRTLARLHP